MTATIISEARKTGRVILNEVESKQMLSTAGIAVVAARVAGSAAEAVALAADAGYPVVLKVLSEDVPHKSDAGGVRLGLRDADGVRAAYEAILQSVRAAVPSARIDGVSVQRQAAPGTEVIVGAATDAQFGPVLMFGLGGVFVEVLKDVSFRIVPLGARDAREMVHEVRGLPLLQGYRGAPPADLGAIEAMLLRLSAFMEAHADVAEVDLNPVFAYSDGAVAVDARIVLHAAGAQENGGPA